MKKLAKFLLVRRPETKDKWWHRFVLVLIYGSILVLVIYLAALFVTEEGGDWINESYTAYNFEQGYATAKGKEIDCSVSVFESAGRLPTLAAARFRCGDIDSNTEFLDRYAQARGTTERLQELRGLQDEQTRSYIPVAERQETKTDNEIMVELIQSGELSDLKVKRTLAFDHGAFFGGWGLYFLLVLVLVLSWLVFWESIVYRTILFIIFGKKK